MSSPEESHRIQDLSWQAFESYVETEDHPIALVPIGSTEQHGPHLPLGVDGYEAKDVAEEIAEEAGVLVAPPIWYGDAAHHEAFPGTISLDSETVIAVLEDVYESLLGHGVSNIITVNGHRMANLPAIDIASKRTREDHPDSVLATIDLIRVAIRAYNELRDGDPEDGMHGGEFETSHMLARHPELVDETKFEPELGDSWSRFSSRDFTSVDDSIPTASSSHDWSEDALGHHGDPTKASAEKGEQLIEAIVENGVEFIEDLRAMREDEDD